jgi:4-aminobutyrate aminotransferase/(S)-3-amino-2-methylpropionate transaminase
MALEFDWSPRIVAPVETRYRRITSPFPPPEAVPFLERLACYEPRAMRCEPPVIWDRAEGFQVRDAWGNCWIDWTSAGLVANAGHGRDEIRAAIAAQADRRLLAAFAFPTEPRARLVERLASLLPEPLAKVLLLTTGSEAVEGAIQLCRMFGLRQGGRSKHVIVSFDRSFHGRTLGAQLASDGADAKEWVVHPDPGFVHVPFPDGFWNADVTFELFQRRLRESGVEPQSVAGVIVESYQGGSGAFAPRSYMEALRKWCTGHKALLVCDEVQAGFGRTGAMWAFEHYGVVPDLVCFGAGLSGALPLSALAGRSDVLDLVDPGAMTSTHAGNPVCCAAALASLELILSENLFQRARRGGELLHGRLASLAARFPQLGFVGGRGLTAGVACVRRGSHEPDAQLAFDIVQRAVEKGVLLFSPVGPGSATVRICPPLVISEDALAESLDAFAEAVREAASQA